MYIHIAMIAIAATACGTRTRIFQEKQIASLLQSLFQIS